MVGPPRTTLVSASREAANPGIDLNSLAIVPTDSQTLPEYLPTRKAFHNSYQMCRTVRYPKF